MQGKVSTISVVIPAYNRESTIADTLESLLRQTYEDWEAIIVDDGSRDATAEVVSAYSHRDERIRLHRQTNAGVSAARNAGIALADGPWLFFLDADDWIVPTAFDSLFAAASVDGIDAAYGGYVRVDEQGRETRERRPPHAEDLFPVFTQMCAFAIHACLIRIELVRSAGGFDESLITCEDWDLWQRVARAGARFAAIPDYVAYYRMRSQSASVNGARMLGDGLKVIARGHSEDARVDSIPTRNAAGAPTSSEPLARLYFACYAAGLVIADGADARWMLEHLGDLRPPDADASGVAETLFYAVPNGRAAAPDEWAQFPVEIFERCRQFVDALGEWMRDRWLGFQARRALERLTLGSIESAEPRTVGAWHLTEVDCLAAPPPHLSPGPAVEHLLCSIKVGSRAVGSVELPVIAGWVPPRVLADRIAAEHAWEILGAYFATSVYPELEVTRATSGVQVDRGGVLLATGTVPPLMDFGEWLHDQVGWAVLLQELRRLPDWTNERFYSEEPEPLPGSVLKGGRAPIAVELTEPLPAIDSEWDTTTIGLTLAGIPIATLRLAAVDGRVEPATIRRAALTQLGFGLCCEVVRELILAPARTAPLAEILAAATASRTSLPAPDPEWVNGVPARPLIPGWHRALPELLEPGMSATVIGRRRHGADGTTASRYAVLPQSAAPALLAGAIGGGDPALEIGTTAAGCVAYAPCLQWDRPALEGGGELGANGNEPHRRAPFAGLRRLLPRRRTPTPPAETRDETAMMPRLPILMYHRVATAGSAQTARWRIDPDDFAQQLELLHDAGYYSLAFDQWRTAIATRQVPPGKPIILTFDDGFPDFLREAAPLLKEYGFSATVFVVAELIGRRNEWDADLGESLPLMGWEEIEQLHGEGFDIGSHSAKHLPLVTLDPGRLADDLARSKLLLEERLDSTVSSLSYPFGLHDAAVQSVAGTCGYEFAVTTDEWPASWSDSLLALPRLEVHGDRTIEDFATLLRS